MSSADESTVVTACGVHSSLGGGVDGSAAFRCGLVRAQELGEWPAFDEETLEEYHVAGHPAAGVMEGFQAVARLAKLGNYALSDLNTMLGVGTLSGLRIGVHLAIGTDFASSAEDGAPERAERVLRRLEFDEASLGRDLATMLYPGSSFGVLHALRSAAAAIRGRDVDACIVGVVDSNLLTQRLTTGLAQRRIKTMDQPVGFSPGEAAVFLLLECEQSVRDRGVRVGPRLAAVSFRPHAVAKEQAAPGGAAPPSPLPDGVALQSAIDEALDEAHINDAATGAILVDLNGETRRAIEFSNAMLRSAHAAKLQTWAVEMPGTSFGDTGAASALQNTALAFLGMGEASARGRAHLVTVSGETGVAGAVLLTEAIDG